MGRSCKFHRPLTRAELPSWPRAMGVGGRHKGITPPNVPWEIFVACTASEGVDMATYLALHTSVDLDGLYDILEMSDAASSWKSAATMNAREGTG